MIRKESCPGLARGLSSPDGCGQGAEEGTGEVQLGVWDLAVADRDQIKQPGALGTQSHGMSADGYHDRVRFFGFTKFVEFSVSQSSSDWLEASVEVDGDAVDQVLFAHHV